MSNIISKEELLEKYKGLQGYIIKILQEKHPGVLDESHKLFADLDSFMDFYKGIDCTMCSVSDIQHDLPTIRDEEVMAVLNMGYCSIISKDKHITNELKMLRLGKDSKKGDTVGIIRMKQATPEGVYELILYPPNIVFDYSGYHHLSFTSNEALAREANKIHTEMSLSLEEIVFRYIHGISYIPRFFEERFSIPQINVSREEFSLLANKIYRKGLPYVVELAKNGGTLEITDEDRGVEEEHNLNESSMRR